jgi:adenylate cyclase, class 1
VKLEQPHKPQTVGIPVDDNGHQEIIRRFKRLHQLRLQRVQAALLPGQQAFLALLALLFHRNSPALPGFNTEDTPSGVANYAPDTHTLLTARAFSKNYAYKIAKTEGVPINAIFLMSNSSGLVFAKNIELIVWVCHQPDLSERERAAIQLKAQNITLWAQSLGLVVKICPIDSLALLEMRVMPPSLERLGDVPSVLLREEFYRTAIYIAGKIPLWWLVPPQEELNYADYVAYLQTQGYSQAHECIDFGGMAHLSPKALLDAMLENFHAALHAPYQALPTLLLLESYADEYPQPNWLCVQLKQAIYAGNIDINDLDSTVLAYRKLDHYCRERPKVLLIIRHCLYFKLMNLPSASDRLSVPLKTNVSQALRSELLQKIAQESHWPASLLPDLMSCKSWSIGKANADYEIMQAQLRRSFVHIQAFIQKHRLGKDDTANFDRLSGRLRAFLSPKHGIVDIISTQGCVWAREDELSLVESVAADGSPEWRLFSGKVSRRNQEDHHPIKRTCSYFSAWVWLVGNNLYHKRIAINVDAQSQPLLPQESDRICRHLQSLLKNYADAVSHNLEDYCTANAGLANIGFINMGNLEIRVRQDGEHLLSPRSDALSYGMNHDCLIQRIDSVTFSRWGELRSNSYIGVAGLFEYFTDILNTLTKPLQPEQLQLVCYTPIRGNIILHRLHMLFKHLCQVFAQAEQPQIIRYFLAAGSSYYCIQCHEGIFRYWAIPSKAQLYKILGEPQVHFSQAVFDPEIVLKSIIPALYTFNQPKKIQVFYLSAATHVDFYLLDEKGALFKQQYPLQNLEHILNGYALFLEGALAHYFYGRKPSVAYYEIQQIPGKGLSRRAVQLNPIKPVQKLVIQVSADYGEGNVVRYWIYCNGQAFSSSAHGKAAFRLAGEHIAQWRRDHPQDPVYLTTMKVPLTVLGVEDIEQLQSIHLLHFKEKLAGRLQLQ